MTRKTRNAAIAKTFAKCHNVLVATFTPGEVPSYFVGNCSPARIIEECVQRISYDDTATVHVYAEDGTQIVRASLEDGVLQFVPFSHARPSAEAARLYDALHDQHATARAAYAKLLAIHAAYNGNV